MVLSGGFRRLGFPGRPGLVQAGSKTTNFHTGHRAQVVADEQCGSRPAAFAREWFSKLLETRACWALLKGTARELAHTRFSIRPYSFPGRRQGRVQRI